MNTPASTTAEISAAANVESYTWHLLRSFLLILRRQWLLVAICAAVGVALGLALYSTTPPSFKARGKFLIDKIPFAQEQEASASENVSINKELTQSFIQNVSGNEMRNVIADILKMPRENVRFKDLDVRLTGAPKGGEMVVLDMDMQKESRSGTVSATASSSLLAANAVNVVLDEMEAINRIAAQIQLVDLNLKLARGRMDQLITQLATITSDRVKFEMESKQLDEHLKKGIAAEIFPAFHENLTLNNLLTQRILVRGEYSGVVSVSVRGPRLDAKRAELAGFEEQIKGYVKELITGLRTSFEIAKTREVLMEDYLKEHQQRMSELEGLRSRLVQSIGNVAARRQLEEEGIVKKASRQQGSSFIVVVDRANAPVRASSPRLGINLMLGLVFGLSLGSCSALLRHIMDRRLRNPAQIVSYSGVPCLAVLTRAENQKTWMNSLRKSATRLDLPGLKRLGVKAQAAHLHENAGLAFLRSQLLRAVSSGQADKIFSFTALGSNAKNSRVVADLAVLLARSERRTLVVDLHLRRPRLAKMLGVEAEQGLCEWFSSDDKLEHYITYSAVKELAVLHAGDLQDDPDDLLTRRPLADALVALQSSWDFILIDGPPFMDVWHMTAAAPVGSPIIAVAAYQQANLDDLWHLATRCENAYLKLAGVVLHDCPPFNPNDPLAAFEADIHHYLLAKEII
ncbi:MAG: AAA family ATPase [bacterium]